MCNNVNEPSLQTNLPSSIAIPPSLPSPTHLAIADSGATTNLLRLSSSQLLRQDPVHQAISVGLPNNNSIQSLHSGNLLYGVSDHSLPAYTFSDSDLRHNLLSLSSITNIGCQVLLTNVAIDITIGELLVYHGHKLPTDTLWFIDIDRLQLGLQQPSHSTSMTIQLDTDADFVSFMHAVFGSPPTSTFINAARRGWLSRVPRLTATMIAANAPNAVATAMGYLDQTRQVKKSRRRLESSPLTHVDSSEPDNVIGAGDEALADVYIKLVPTSDIAHVDLAGRFPVKSRKGNEYILVAVWDNYIHYEPMASRSASHSLLQFCGSQTILLAHRQ